MLRSPPPPRWLVLSLLAACAPVKIVGDDPASFQAHCERALSPGASPATQEIHAGTCYEIGRAYLEGAGVPQDAARGVGYLDKACGLDGLGARQGCLALGDALVSGVTGVPKDVLRAAVAFERSCALGQAEGCLRAGLLLDGGDGHPRDALRALSAYEQGCDRGAGDACAFAAAALVEGGAVPKDRERALARAERGCTLDHGPSCFVASALTRDPDAAQVFRKKACALGESCEGPTR